MKYKIFTCPHCGKKYKVADDYPCRKVVCNELSCRRFKYFDLLLEDGETDSLPEITAPRSIRFAAMFGSPQYLESLLHAPDIVDEDPEADPPLFAAAANTVYPEVLDLLIRHGGDLTSRGREGEYIFHKAAANPYIAIMSRLAEFGCDVNARDSRARQPIHFAAMKNPSPEAIDFLISLGADPESEDEDGFTTLHYAAENPSLPVFENFLSFGLFCNKLSDNGYTPFLIAAENANLGVVKKLLSLGINVNQQRNPGGTSALWYAVENSDIEFLRLLIEASANMNIRDDYGRTPLHHAAECCNIGIIRMLVEAGADVKVKDGYGSSMIFYAINNVDLNVLRYFIEAGADVNASEEEGGHTALDYAKLKKLSDVIFILEQHGAKSGKDIRREQKLRKKLKKSGGETKAMVQGFFKRWNRLS